jgi:hypothetical protein
MVYIEINKDPNSPDKMTEKIDFINKHLQNKNNKMFILFYMEGCGPCNATRPEWHKMKNVISDNFLKRKDVAIVSIDKDYADKLKHVKSQPAAFPTMRYMTDSGEVVENYEDSEISSKDRTIDSFVEWIKFKTGEKDITSSEKKGHVKTKKRSGGNQRGGKKMGTGKRRIGGKWSLKYKKSINCRRPKGFSQKQHCKYGRKHLVK